MVTRRARGLDLLAGFEQGMNLAGSVMKTNEERAIKDELAKVSMLSPEGGIDDGGQARAMAQAAVYDRYGRVDDAVRLRSQAQQAQLATLQVADVKARGEREATRFSWQSADQARQERERQRDDEYKAGRIAAFQTTAFAQKEGAFEKSMQTYNKAKAEYDAAVERGDASAVAPSPPMAPQTTIGETLRDHATILAHDIKYGKASNDDILKFQKLRKNVEDEGYTRVLQAAQAGAPLTQVVAMFNANGEQKIDPASIVSDKTVSRDSGVKSRIITFKGGDGSMHTIDTYADLSAVGQGDKLFEQALKLRSAANQDAQVAISRGHLGVAQADAGRRATEFKEAAPEREAKHAIAELTTRLANTEDPKEQAAIEGKLKALRTGTRSGGGAVADPASVREAQALVTSGAAPDMATALDAVIGKGDRMHQAYVEAALKRGDDAERAVAQANKLMTSTGHTQSGGRWVKSGANGPAPPAAAVDALRKNPDRAAEFDAKFGAGAARRALSNDGWGTAGR